MAFIFDGITRTITEQALPGNPPIATYDVLRDLWSAGEDWWYTSDNQKYAFPFRLAGGGLRFVDDLGNEIYATADIFLQNQSGQNWRIIPANYQHIVRFSGANLFAENRSLPIYNLSSLTSSVIIEPTLSDVQTSYLISSTGSGATPQQVWEYSNRSLTDKTGFSLSPVGINDIVSGVWNAATRTLTSAISSFTVADIWSYATRSLTDKNNFNLSTSERTAIAEAVEDQLADDFANIDVSVTVSPQGIRDAMKLAPSGGTPAEGSIDAVLETIKDQAEIAAKVNQI